MERAIAVVEAAESTQALVREAGELADGERIVGDATQRVIPEFDGAATVVTTQAAIADRR